MAKCPLLASAVESQKRKAVIASPSLSEAENSEDAASDAFFATAWSVAATTGAWFTGGVR